MKTKLLCLSLMFLSHFSYSATAIVDNNPFPFDPNTVINEGDFIDFQIPGHNAVEVSQATYDANTNSPTLPGGFSTPVGGGMVQFNTAGTYYYVCTIHGGMKAIITVQSATGVKKGSDNVSFLEVNPNPVSSFSTINFSLKKEAEIEMVVTNNLGANVLKLGSKVYGQGEHNVEINAAGLENGLYNITLILNGEAILSRKIIVKK